MYGIIFKRPIVIVVIAISALNILMGLTSDSLLDFNNYSFWVGWILLILFPVLMVVRIESMVKSVKMFDKEVEYTFTEKGIEVMTEASSVKSDWSNFDRTFEYDEWLLIYVNKLSAYIIKKRDINEIDYLYIYQLLKKLNLPGKLTGKYPAP